jgi:signal transduction histidine kinase
VMSRSPSERSSSIGYSRPRHCEPGGGAAAHREELHDDLSQKIALLGIDVVQMRLNLALPEQRPSAREVCRRRWTRSPAICMRCRTSSIRPGCNAGAGRVGARLCARTCQSSAISRSPSARPHSTRLDPSVSLCLYRITQEALHNVGKHSQSARRLGLGLERDGD